MPDGNDTVANMSTDKLIALIQQTVQSEVRSQGEATIMMSNEAATQVEKPRYVEATLLVGETLPLKFTHPQAQTGEKTGHRADLVDLITDADRRYYNVSVQGPPETATPFGEGQKFLIYFPNSDAEDEDYGMSGVSNLFAVPIKVNRLRKAFNEVLSTYTPGSKKGLENMKKLPFCSKVPTQDDVMNKVTPVTPQMRVFSSTRTPKEMEEAFEKRLREELGLSDDDLLPDRATLKEIFNGNPELLEKIKSDTNNNSDRPSIVITETGIAMGHPKGAARVSMSEEGTAYKGKIDQEQKPQEPMDPIGVAATGLPMDLLPQGNVLIPHPKKLPVLDEILSMGLMIYRMKNTIVSMGKIMKSLSNL